MRLKRLCAKIQRRSQKKSCGQSSNRQGWCNLLMNRPILFTCACYLQSCSDCSLNGLGCDYAPEGQLLKAAREHYAEMKNSKDFDVYNAGIAKRFGADYAKEFIAAKAKVV